MRKISFLILLSFASSLWAQSVSVRVLKGTATSGADVLKVGSAVAHGQTVKTGPQTTLILSYPDESKIKIKENAEIVIHAPPPGGLEPSGLDLIQGAVFSMVNPQKGAKFQVKTKTAVAGVRGTKFFTSFDKKAGAAKMDVWMCVEEGAVEMTELTHPKPVLVRAGFGVLVEEGKAIAAPKKFAWTKKLNWNMGDTAGEIEDKTQISEAYKDKLLKSNYD